jgi:hypothetical protein
MKKLILIIACLLASVGMTIAQDVYTAGTFSWNGRNSAGIWKNTDFMYEELSTTDYYYTAEDVLVHHGDVYWILNEYTRSDNKNHRAWLYKNHERLSCGSATYLNSLFQGYGHVYAAGYYETSNGPQAILLRDDMSSPLYTFDGSWSFANAGLYYNTHIYVGGTAQANKDESSPKFHAKIWRDGEELYTISGNNVHLYDMDVFNEHVYSIVHDGQIRVYRDEEVLYTLESEIAENFYTAYWDIQVDAGNIYVSGLFGEFMAVYKNGELLYLHDNPGGIINALCANSKGVYSAGINDKGVPFIFDHIQSTFVPVASNCDNILGIYIDEECDLETRTLPYTEKFEPMTTDWPCWYEFSSFVKTTWERWEFTPGDYCARASWNHSTPEASMLITPRIFLQPGRDETKLVFNHRDYLSGYTPSANTKEIWISTTTNQFYNFTKIWTAPTNLVSDWESVEIDLKEYQGEAVYIAFKYSGTMAWSWLIDDVSIREEWMPGLIQSTPYSESFTDYEPGYYWYILDEDHSGHRKCWQNDYEYHAAYHPADDAGDFQTGWLFSPLIHLEGGKHYELSFDSQMYYWNTDSRSSVWITNLDGENDVPDPSYYYYLGDIRSSDNELFTSTFDLSEYAGDNIRVAFKYEGTIAHDWYLDDVIIQESTAPTYKVTTSIYPEGAGIVEGGGNYLEGSICTLKAIPNEGYQLGKWYVNGNIGPSDAVYSFRVTRDVSIEATFQTAEINYYTVNVGVIPAGTGTVDGVGTYPSGTTVTLTAIPNEGFAFDKWNDGNTENPREIVISNDINFFAYFKTNGVSESQDSKLTLYPNPVKENLRIKGIEKECQGFIYNSLGMLVKTVTVNDEQEIKVNDLASGLYLIRCGSQTIRFVKED